MSENILDSDSMETQADDNNTINNTDNTNNKYYCNCSNKDYKTYIGYYYHCNTQKHKRFIGAIEKKVEEDPKERRRKYYKNLDPEKKKILLNKIKEQSKLRRDKLKIESYGDEPMTIINIVDKKPEDTTKELLESLQPSIFKVYKASTLTLKPKPGYKFAVCSCGAVINDYHRKTHEKTAKHKFIIETLGNINKSIKNNFPV